MFAHMLCYYLTLMRLSHDDCTTVYNCYATDQIKFKTSFAESEARVIHQKASASA